MRVHSWPDSLAMPRRWKPAADICHLAGPVLPPLRLAEHRWGIPVPILFFNLVYARYFMRLGMERRGDVALVGRRRGRAYCLYHLWFRWFRWARSGRLARPETPDGFRSMASASELDHTRHSTNPRPARLSSLHTHPKKKHSNAGLRGAPGAFSF